MGTKVDWGLEFSRITGRKPADSAVARQADQRRDTVEEQIRSTAAGGTILPRACGRQREFAHRAHGLRRGNRACRNGARTRRWSASFLLASVAAGLQRQHLQPRVVARHQTGRATYTAAAAAPPGQFERQQGTGGRSAPPETQPPAQPAGRRGCLQSLQRARWRGAGG